jgi:FtsZ-binding cell division protein ZapB
MMSVSFVTELRERITILQEALDSEKNLRKRLYDENQVLIEENREMADQIEALRTHLEEIERLR